MKTKKKTNPFAKDFNFFPHAPCALRAHLGLRTPSHKKQSMAAPFTSPRIAAIHCFFLYKHNPFKKNAPFGVTIIVCFLLNNKFENNVKINKFKLLTKK